MQKLIEVNTAKEFANTFLPDPILKMAVNAVLNNCPAAEEYEPVVHARWENHKCTNCGGPEHGYYDPVEDCIVHTPTERCAKCGAHMDGGSHGGNK